MDRKKAAMTVGGIALLGIAAYFLLGQDKAEDDFGPSGGSSYGGYGGYEGGGPGITYNFGGDTVNFPGGNGEGLGDIMNALAGGGLPDGTSKKGAAAGGPQIVGLIQKPADFQAVTIANMGRYGIPAKFTAGQQDGQAGGFQGLSASLGGVLDMLFRPAVAAGGALSGIASTKSGSGISAGGSQGIAKKAFVVANTGTGFYSSSGGGRTYNQADPGAPGSGYAVRGYSLTGKPLYRPVK